jgi:hypothetical protein
MELKRDILEITSFLIGMEGAKASCSKKKGEVAFL